MDKYKET